MSQHRVALLQSQWCLEGGGNFPMGMVVVRVQEAFLGNRFDAKE